MPVTDPTLRACVLGLLEAASRKYPATSLHVFFDDNRAPLMARLDGHLPGPHFRQLRDDLRALKVPYECAYRAHTSTWGALTVKFA